MPQPKSYFSHHWYGHYVRFDSYDSIKQKYEQTKPLLVYREQAKASA